MDRFQRQCKNTLVSRFQKSIKFKYYLAKSICDKTNIISPLCSLHQLWKKFEPATSNLWRQKFLGREMDVSWPSPMRAKFRKFKNSTAKFFRGITKSCHNNMLKLKYKIYAEYILFWKFLPIKLMADNDRVIKFLWSELRHDHWSIFEVFGHLN